jgi:hypothetical protein
MKNKRRLIALIPTGGRTSKAVHKDIDRVLREKMHFFFKSEKKEIIVKGKQK